MIWLRSFIHGVRKRLGLVKDHPIYSKDLTWTGIAFHKCSIFVDPRDVWVGIFWDHINVRLRPGTGSMTACLVIYVCFLPCLPIKLVLVKTYT